MFDMSQFQNSMESFIRENDKSLRSIFSGKIKGTFLTAIKVNVMQMLGPEIFKYYDMQLTNEKLVSTGFEKPDFDICHHIVGIHRSNLIFNTEEERLKKEKSIEYKNALVNDVITNIKLRQYGSVFFQKQVITLAPVAAKYRTTKYHSILPSFFSLSCPIAALTMPIV